MLIEQDADKELVHTRQITCLGYRRRDGLWQIEASVADEKGQAVPFNSRPAVLPGELIHHFSLCVLIDDDYQIRDVAAIVESVVPGSRITFGPDPGPDKRNYRVNCDKIQQVLPEFQPQWDARRGAQELYDSYCRLGLKLDDFEGPRYKRIAHIKQLIEKGSLDQSLRWTKEPASFSA